MVIEFSEETRLRLNQIASKKLLWFVLFDIILFILLAPTFFINLSTRDQRFEVTNAPYHKVAIVLGAGVYPDGTPTPYLQNRIHAAVDLYKNGRVKQILMSGDNSTEHYNEPTVMKQFAVEQGVPDEDIYIDYAGFSTYDTCYRAKHIFGVTDATVISQGYHLPRAVFTCSMLGINTSGVAARKNGRDYTVSYLLREIIATDKALIETSFQPKPTVMGDPEPIPR